MQRHILGICALVLLSGAIVYTLSPPDVNSNANVIYAACVRVGSLCAVIWLAYRDLVRLPSWIGSVIVVAAVFVAIRPRLAIIAVPLVIALMILGRKKKRDRL